jgi:CheY-like chemotaxis protein/ligand-binding sensor domain-containing protein
VVRIISKKLKQHLPKQASATNGFFSTLALVALVVAGAAALRSQPKANLQLYGREAGLPPSPIRNIYEDRVGFLWLATESGLLRFDGRKFDRFQTQDGLPSSSVIDVVQSAEGTIWASTSAGVARLQGSRFEKIEALGGNGVALGEIAALAKSGIAVATNQGLKALVDGQSKPMSAADNQNLHLLKRSGKSGLWSAGQGQVWQWSDAGDKRKFSTAEGVPNAPILSLGIDADDTVWLTTGTQIAKKCYGCSKFESASIQDQHIRRFFYSSGRMSALTDAGAVLVWQENAWKSAFPLAEAQEAATAAIWDRNGTLWLGYREQGLGRYQQSSNWSYLRPFGEVNPSVDAVCESTETGRLFLTGGGRLAIRERDGSQKTVTENLGKVNRLFCASKNVWIGSAERGLLLYSENNASLSNVASVASSTIHDITVDTVGSVWTATKDGLFNAQFNADSKSGDLRFQKVEIPPMEGNDLTPYHVVTNVKGDVWVATPSGLMLRRANKWQRWGKEQQFPTEDLRLMVEGRPGEIWMASTGAGVIHFVETEEGPQVETFTAGNRLRSDNVRFIEKDPQGWIWIGSDQGVDVFRSGEWQHLDESNGMQWADVSSNAFSSGTNGAAWIGTSRGLLRYATSQTWKAAEPPTTIISKVLIAGRDETATTNAKVKNGEAMQIEFRAPYLLRPEAAKFRYRLSGPDSAWLDVNGTSLQLPRLAAGDYTLEVQALGEDGRTPGQAAKYSFEVEPKFLDSLLAKAALFLAFLLGTGGMIFLREKRLKFQKNELIEALSDGMQDIEGEKSRLEQLKKRLDEQQNQLATRTQSPANSPLTAPLTAPLSASGIATSLPEDRRQIEQLSLKVADQTREIQRLGVESERLTSELAHRAPNVFPAEQSKMEGMLRKLQEQDLQIQKLTQQLGVAQTALAATQNTRSNVDADRLSALQQQTEAQQGLIEQLTAQLRRGQLDLGQVRQDLVKSRQETDNQSQRLQEIQQLREELTHLREANAALQQRTDSSEEQLRLRGNTSQAEFDQLLAQLQTTRAELAALQTKYASGLAEQVRRLDEQRRWSESQRQETETIRSQSEQNRLQLEAKARQNEQQVQQLIGQMSAANRVQTEFLANITHEIRTPLNGILGMTQLALSTKLTAEQREYLELAESSGRSLLSLMNDILDFSKIEAGKLELERVSFSLRDLLTELVRPMAFTAKAKGLELIYELGDNVPGHVIGDPTRLRQVLTNLLSNAIKFTPEGMVNLSVSTDLEDASRICFSVIDTGIGIDPAKHEEIFAPFQQADGSMTRRFGGTGLGLSISRRLVDAMGGEIKVQSAPSKGSRFSFSLSLPAITEAEHPTLEIPVVSQRVTESDEPARVLLVEDNPVSRRFALRLLERQNCEVVEADSGTRALKLLQTVSFDLVLMDLQMPDMDGFTTTEKIRAMEKRTGRHVPIVILTASGSMAERQRALDAGADDYLLKPVRIGDLYRVLENYAGAR